MSERKFNETMQAIWLQLPKEEAREFSRTIHVYVADLRRQLSDSNRRAMEAQKSKPEPEVDRTPHRDFPQGDCPECRAGSPVSHNGSAGCRSGSIASGGSKAHCTCDTCF